jgi:hypothetical protein
METRRSQEGIPRGFLSALSVGTSTLTDFLQTCDPLAMLNCPRCCNSYVDGLSPGLEGRNLVGKRSQNDVTKERVCEERLETQSFIAKILSFFQNSFVYIVFKNSQQSLRTALSSQFLRARLNFKAQNPRKILRRETDSYSPHPCSPSRWSYRRRLAKIR